MGVLIDTNVLIKWERQRATLTLENLRSYFPIHVSAVTVGELYTGVYRSISDKRRVERESYFRALFNMMQVVHFDERAAQIYGKMVAKMMAVGMMTGKNDIMIAATAVCYGLPVLTGDKDFDRIPFVEVIKYGDSNSTNMD